MSVQVSVNVCTYMRPALLKGCLYHLLQQETSFPYEIVVVDNDAEESAKPIVRALQSEALCRNIPLRYEVEPVQNISLARNKGVRCSAGELIAFIDDDEYPQPGWLEALHSTLGRYAADGVVGPVIPEFPAGFPKSRASWGLFRGTRMATGSRRSYASTANLLVSAECLKKFPGPFDPQFGKIGGGDNALIQKLVESGAKFYWCDEAVVHEIQELRRATLRWHLVRGYVGGYAYTGGVRRAQGTFLSVPIVLASILLGAIRAVRDLPRALHSPSATGIWFARKVAIVLGRIGYFFGLKLEAYKKRSLGPFA